MPVKDGLPVVLVVPLLVEALPAELTDPGLVPVVDPHVGVQRRAPELLLIKENCREKLERSSLFFQFFRGNGL